MGSIQNTNTNKFRGKKCYDNDNKMSWMDSSIDLSQPNIVNYGRKDAQSQERTYLGLSKPNKAELSTYSNFPSNGGLRKSCEFIPMHHPYEWNAQKPLKPLKNNSLMRISEDVGGKVTEVQHDRSLYQK